jgi:hypothetical protein
MKLATTVKGLVTRPARKLSSWSKRADGEDTAPYWLPGQPHAGQASEFESWPPTAQDDPASPGNHQPVTDSRATEPTARK